MPFIISNVNNWPITIPDATDTVEGVIKLSDIPAHAGTLATIYDNGSVQADQTLDISAAKGGGIILQALALGGSLFKAFDSAANLLFNILNGNIPTVLAAGAVIQNDPGFGSPAMGSQTFGSFMSYTADCDGVNWGGTGVTPQANGADSNITLSLNDVALYNLNKFGFSIDPTKAVGVNGVTGAPNPIAFVAGQLFATTVGAGLTIASNTIAPVAGVHHVGAGLLKTITVPLSGNFRGSIVLVPDAAFTYDATDNIGANAGMSGSAAPNTAVVGIPMIATYDGTKWWMSY